MAEPVLTLSITGVGSALQGVGRTPEGVAVFVAGALPGERVAARVIRRSGRFWEARLEEVLSPAPQRAQPRCPHYGTCGGCQAQHMDYACSLALKRQKVFDALTRIGGLKQPNVLEPLGMEAPWRYRNKAEYAVAAGPGGRPVIGYFYPGSHRVMPMDDCPLQREESLASVRVVARWMAENRVPGWDSAAARGVVRHLVTRLTRSGQLMVVLATSGRELPHAQALDQALRRELPGMAQLVHCASAPRPAHPLDGRCRVLSGPDTLTDALMDLRFELSPQSFFQVNPLQAEALQREALRAAQLTGREMVVDAYCGAGTLSLCMAREAQRVTGVEIVAPAVENARRNARLNGLMERCSFVLDDAARALPRMLADGGTPDVLVVDPPRKGVDGALIEAALRVMPRRVVYVSCNPATLARDVKLLATGGYQLAWARPVDMFCWTEHVETVVLMSRKEG